jgi:hypothetical protein
VVTRIIRDDNTPFDKEIAIAFAGDKPLGAHELRRLSYNQDAKVARVAESLYPEGFVVRGMVPTVLPVTNELPHSNDFTAWTAENSAGVTPAAALDRYGDTVASRLVGALGQDAFISESLGTPTGRGVVSVDLQLDTTPNVRLSVWNGVTEIAVTNLTLTGTITRYEIPIADWGVGATEATLRVRPGPGSQPGTCFISHAQFERKLDGEPLEAGAYVATNGAAATAPGNRVTFVEGSVQLAGYPRAFAEQTLVLDPTKAEGIDVIYAELAARYYEGDLYEYLEHPTTGAPGNDSVVEKTQLVTTDTTDPEPAVDPTPTAPQYLWRVAEPIFQIDRATGQVMAVVERSEIDLTRTSNPLDGERILPRSLPEDRLDSKATEGQPGLLSALARRMKNQSGGFVMPTKGATPSITQDLTDATQVKVKIEPLDGYTPDGRSHYLEEPEVLTAPLQTGFAVRSNENHVYYAGTDTYKVAKTPLIEVLELVGIIEDTVLITRGPVPGGQDELPNTPVYQVLDVRQGATVYAVGPGGTVIQNGDTIDWSPATGDDPIEGSTYEVTYRYSRTWPAGEFTYDGQNITFTGAKRPVDTLPFTLKYKYGQNRVDYVILGANGLEILPGAPSDHPAPPPVPVGAMGLWEMLVRYGVSAVTFTERFVVGVPMAEHAAIKRKVDDLSYNVAQLAASVALRDRNSAMKGIVTDPFFDDRQFDQNAAFLALPGKKKARIEGERLKMARTEAEVSLAIDAVKTTFVQRGNWAGLPYTSVAKVSQNKYSDAISVNPFSNYEFIPPLITTSAQAWSGVSRGFTGALTVKGVNFQPNEAGIVIRVDGVSVATVAANAQGAFSHTFTRFLTATSIVTAEGAGGVPRSVVGSNIRWPRRDPVAQTYVNEVAGDLTEVWLYFASKDTTKPVVVTVRSTQSGIPSEEILALRVFQPSEVNVNGQPTKFVLDEPLPQDGDVGYTVVAASDSAAYRLQFAELSKRNLGPAGGYITSNAYGRGVMLASSDGRTWTPYQDKDLRFDVLMAAYATTGSYKLVFARQDYPLGITGFNLAVNQRVMQGATIAWQYSTDDGLTWAPFDPTREILLAEVAFSLTVQAIANTTKANAGVAVSTQNVLLKTYKAEVASSYVSLQTTLLQSVSNAKVYLESLLPPGTNTKVFLTNDGGTTWATANQVASRAIAGTNLYEYEYAVAFGTPNNKLRTRVDLEASTPTSLPEVEKVSTLIL